MKKQKLNRRRRGISPLIAVVALVLIIGGGITIYRWTLSNSVSSRVILDVNPSIQLNVSNKEKVLSAEAKNNKGEKVLENMNLENTDLNVAINALLGSMLQNGYLSDIQNAILVSVENDDEAEGASLQARLTKEIEQILSSNHLDSLVFSQTVVANQDIVELSNQYNISEGKASLINEIIKGDNKLTFEELAQLSVHEIALIMEYKEIETKEITRSGHASEKAYIGKEQAKAIAFAHANVDSKQAKIEEIEFDTDDGVILYEIDFNVGSTEYEYEIHAVTGEIINHSKEVKGNNNSNQNENISKDSSFIGRDKAKKAALSHSKVDENQVRKIEIDFDNDDNKEVYKVEFKTNEAEYEYKIDARTGAVLEFEREDKKSSNSDKKPVSDNSSEKDYIGKDEAKAIALNHAGVNESAIRDYEIELDKDYNSVVYEIDFESNDTEYEYEIDAYTGEVLKSQSKVSNNTTSKSQTTYLSESKIKEIVFQHAGVNGGNVTELEIELDGNHDDDDTPIYEVDFQVDRLEYEYEVDAITGKIIESKVEQDD